MLNRENDRTYTREMLSSDHKRQAVEKTVPDDYSMTAEKKDNTIVIKNAYTERSEESDELPQTGQLWWLVPILTIIGVTLYVLGRFQRRMREF